MLEFEVNWLSYARAVASDDDHRRRCIEAGGARPIQPEPFAQLRWPGFLGAGYARILCLGMIHNGDMLYAGRSASAPGRESISDRQKSLIDLESPYLDWIAKSVDPQQFLAKVRDVYSRALPSWDPWKRLSSILEHFNYKNTPAKINAIAYSNIAKCWSDTADSKRKDKRVMACCNLWEGGSTVALIGAIRPICILVATVDPGFSEHQLPVLEDGRPPDVWPYHYLHGTASVNGEELLRDEWAKRAAVLHSQRIQAISNLG